MFGSYFDQSLDKMKFPKLLQTIQFGMHFSQSLDNLPNTILNLIFHSISEELTNLPTSLEKMVIQYYEPIESIKKIPFGCEIMDSYNNKIFY